MGLVLGRSFTSEFAREIMNVTYYNESSDEEEDTNFEYEQTFNRPNIMNPPESEPDEKSSALDAILELAELKLSEGDYLTVANHAKTLFNELKPKKQRPIIDTNRVLSRRLLNRSPNIVFDLTYAEKVDLMQSRYKLHYQFAIDDLTVRIHSKKSELNTIKFEKQYKWATIKMMRVVKSNDIEDTRNKHKELVKQEREIQEIIKKLYDELNTTDLLLTRCMQNNYYEFER
jgi:hypothetical protein